MTLNPDKYHFMTVGLPNTQRNVIHQNKITNKLCGRKNILDVVIYNKLSSKSHLKSIFKNTCQKFNVLFYISHYTQRNQWKVLANVFVKSQFSYCPLIWMSCSKGLNSKGNRMYKPTQSTWKWQWIWLGTSTATVTWRKRFTSSMAVFLR